MPDNLHTSKSLGAVVLCGGQSRRMGYAKANLPFGEERLLQRVVRQVREVCSPIVVVAAVGQDLPQLSPSVQIVRDERPELGPLEGIRQGLAALAPQVRFAYVTSCDVPFLSAAFVREVARLRRDAEIAIPKDGRFYHPLAAVYATRLNARAKELIDEGQRRPVALLDGSRVEAFSSELLRQVDPELLGLINTNDPASYRDALKRAGLPVPPDMESIFDPQD